MDQKEVMIKMVLDRWNSLLRLADNFITSYTDDQLAREIALGKNRGIYVWGHLIAIHDEMLAILGLADAQYENLFELFVKQADKSVENLPEIGELRIIWQKQLDLFPILFNELSIDSWFEKHHSISEETFKLEPFRNKLNVLLIRTSHLSYHVGQLALLKNQS